MGAIANTLYAAKSAVVDRMRFGDRTIIWTPGDALGFANLLCLWLQAHRREAVGVLESPTMRLWLEAFPALCQFTVPRQSVRFSDRREWNRTPRLYQRFGVDYTRADLRAFVTDTLVANVPPAPSRRLVVHIRRGDYYSLYREKYAMDLRGYLAEAIDLAGDTDEVLVVSNDPEWVRTSVHDLLVAGGRTVAFSEGGAVDDFRHLCSARRLIGTNSTFSYWGAHVAGVLNRDAQVIMPAFHSRDLPDGRADQLDPSWTVIDGYA